MSRIVVAVIAVSVISLALVGCKTENKVVSSTSETSTKTSQPIQWIESYDNALKLAQEQKKFVLVDFYTEWCGYCKKLDEETYPDPSVASAITQRFIAVKINAEKDQPIASKYRITGYPTMVILNAQGEEVSRIVGYVSPKELTDKLAVL